MSDNLPKGGLQKSNAQSAITRRTGGTALERIDLEAVEAQENARKDYEAIELELKGLENQKEKPAQQTRNSSITTSSGDSSKTKSLVMSALLLIVSLAGFVLLLRISLAGAIVWFLFLLVAYPVILAFSLRAEDFKNEDLLQIYKAGVAQIPAIGEFLSHAIPGESKKKD